jgi:hypothetical protein
MILLALALGGVLVLDRDWLRVGGAFFLDGRAGGLLLRGHVHDEFMIYG